MTAGLVQGAFLGMEPIRPLAALYLDACYDYWEPILERLERDGEIGPDGLSEADMQRLGLLEFVTMDEFAAGLDARGVPYKLRGWDKRQ